MSNRVNEKGELERKVTITAEDIENTKNYSIHFGIDMTPELEKAMNNFVANPSYENQVDFKLELCKWMTTSKNESWTDKLWEKPLENASDALFNLQFEKDLKEELTSESKEDDKPKE